MSHSDHLMRLRECAQYGDTPGVLKKDLRALIADYDEAVRVLHELLLWADWQRKRHPHPMMAEPNTGARESARAVLAKAGGK